MAGSQLDKGQHGGQRVHIGNGGQVDLRHGQIVLQPPEGDWQVAARQAAQEAGAHALAMHNARGQRKGGNFRGNLRKREIKESFNFTIDRNVLLMTSLACLVGRQTGVLADVLKVQGGDGQDGGEVVDAKGLKGGG